MINTSWFLTKNGLIFSRCAVMAASISSFTGYVGLHSWFLDNYRKVFQFYSSGFEKPLSSELVSLSKEVLEESNLTEKQKESFKFFMVCGFDTFHAGSTQLNTGGLVGLPNHFNYTKEDDVEKHAIKLQNNSSVHWSTRAGQSLLDSLVLSRAAQKFATAREIHYCTTSYVYAYGVGGTIAITAAYLLGNGLAVRFQLYRLPLKLRAALYSICGSLGLFLFVTTKDAASQYWDGYADRTAAKTSSEYLNGGIEYYEKCLKRNVALRTLMGEEGEKYFTWHGNRKTFIRAVTLPLTVRLDNLKAMKAKEQQILESIEAN
ncbi:transmembrane protein 177-like [Centruroides sculpturatus]|uniref:transmembrane protein 177-like n=1 Tax=Centruroides sculpturatus TaxID=218467 RepID=UPI000C6EC266|nr:transmembrane protein 177-like [Centruroides sculpturatus]XP_023229331.1 transmembrane protein 177-like [Centruroides sculpturatus]XP_023229333.1 transmembrane protein 177-like [Centruroides sculpturatus]